MTLRNLCPLIALLSFACNGDKDDTATDDTDDTGDSVIVAENGLPEGESTWAGEMSVAAYTYDVEVTLTNTGGDLEGVVYFDYEGLITGSYALSGTHEPISGLVAIAPGDWIDSPAHSIEVNGFFGTHDPDAGTLIGTTADFASGENNYLEGGDAMLTLVSGDGAPTAAGAQSLALPEGSASFSGDQNCSGTVREGAGEIVFDGEGFVEGEITYGDPDIADGSATFEFTGVHNPSTGGITLVPGLYTDPGLRFLSFFVEAAYDPDTGEIDGKPHTNAGSCSSDDGGWWTMTLD